MTPFQSRYLRILNGALRVVSWAWIVLGALGALMALLMEGEGWGGALVGVVLLVAGLVLRRVLPLTPKQLEVFGFAKEQD